MAELLPVDDLAGDPAELDATWTWPIDDWDELPEGVIAKGGSAADRGWGPGWPTNNWSKCTKVRGGGVDVVVRTEIAPLVGWLLDETAKRGYQLRQQDTGGFNNRAIRGSNKPSNHSWGLAVDINWGTNPHQRPLVTDMPAWMPELWKSKNFRWGGDYPGKPDTMHYEFMGTPDDADRLTKELGLASPSTTPSTTPSTRQTTKRPLLKRQDTGDAVRELQTRLTANGFAVEVDGSFGKLTEDAVLAFQRARGLDDDGKVGPKTWAALG